MPTRPFFLEPMKEIFIVSIFGTIGTLLRFYFNSLNNFFPFGTLSVNLIGCLAIGFIFGSNLSSDWKTYLIVGFCGALTTMSGFTIDLVKLSLSQEWSKLLIYFSTTLILCVLGTFIGYKFSQY